MLNAFVPLSQEARAEHRAAYREYLLARDGVVDLERRTLSKREPRMLRYQGFRGDRELDKALFDQLYLKFDARSTSSPELVLLLALVKANAAEAYGVNSIFARILSRVARDPEADIELLLLLEEGYHTRILLSTACIYGMDVSEPYHPPFGFRAMITAMTSTPQALSRPVVLASEVMGTITFLKLLHSARAILKDQPLVRDAVEERIMEVLVDEIGHVTFARLCLGPWGLSQARTMLPWMVRTVRDVIPELSVIGARPTADMSLLEQLPAEVRRAAFLV